MFCPLNLAILSGLKFALLPGHSRNVPFFKKHYIQTGVSEMNKISRFLFAVIVLTVIVWLYTLRIF